LATDFERFTISFPDDFDGQAEFEMTPRGYMSDVIVQLDNGTRYRL
jgi:hypothetical protein